VTRVRVLNPLRAEASRDLAFAIDASLSGEINGAVWLSNASKRARTRSIGSRSRGSLFIFRSSPAVAPQISDFRSQMKAGSAPVGVNPLS
jgi:hypothetical protein